MFLLIFKIDLSSNDPVLFVCPEDGAECEISNPLKLAKNMTILTIQ
jgi:hypothetical protein